MIVFLWLSFYDCLCCWHKDSSYLSLFYLFAIFFYWEKAIIFFLPSSSFLFPELFLSDNSISDWGDWSLGSFVSSSCYICSCSLASTCYSIRSFLLCYWPDSPEEITLMSLIMYLFPTCLTFLYLLQIFCMVSANV